MLAGVLSIKTRENQVVRIDLKLTSWFSGGVHVKVSCFDASASTEHFKGSITNPLLVAMFDWSTVHSDTCHVT